MRHLDHTTTPQIREEFTLPHATLYGGAAVVLDDQERIGLRNLFASHLPKSKRSDSLYPLPDVCTVLVIGTLLGKERLFHFEDLEEDPLLSVKLRLPKLPDHTLLYKDLHRFAGPPEVEALRAVHRKVLARPLRGLRRGILDFDTTVETVYGEQEGTAMGYNPTKPGRASYRPLLAFEGQRRVCVNAHLEGGNVHPTTRFADFYRRTLEQLPSHVRIWCVRFDRGFAGEETFRFLEQEGVHSVGKIRVTDRLLHQPRKWRRIGQGEEIVEVVSFSYQATRWSRPRRVVLIRRREAHPRQLPLLEELLWKYEAMVTTLDWDEEDIWHFYNQRCTVENYIKEQKLGFGIDAIPTAAYWPNSAALLLKIIAYNLYVGFLREVAPKAYRRYTVERMRRMFWMIPGVLVRHARQWILRLWRGFPRQEAFWEMKRRVLAIA